MGAVQKGGGLKRTMEGVRGEGALTKQSSSMVEEEEWDGGGFGRGGAFMSRLTRFGFIFHQWVWLKESMYPSLSCHPCYRNIECT